MSKAFAFGRVSVRQQMLLSLLLLGLGSTPLGASIPVNRLRTSQASEQTIQWPSSSALLVPTLPGLGKAEPYLPQEAFTLHLVIRLGDRRVQVVQNNRVTASFPIAVGRSGWETPAGHYAVRQKIRNPSWQNPFTGEVIPPGSDNPLGTRWIGFWTDGKNHIGFHGTPNVNSVGRAASHGCIRMYDKDVQRLFELVEVGTPVQVVP